MESNQICNWLLHYQEPNSKIINYENIIDVESSTSIREKLCSSICYFECGKVLFDEFPATSTGFIGIFEYLTNNKASVMDKLQDEEQRLFINKLTNSDNFSMRHHVSIIKCFMKTYACQLAPYEMINRALEAIDITGLIENVSIFVTFRHVQRFLILWLREAAIAGLFRLCISTKNLTESQMVAIVDNSPVGSLILYAMVCYIQIKLIKYTVRIPDIDSPMNTCASNFDLFREHSRIVVTVFSDICDNRDILPLYMDCLDSRSMDNVPTTLTIALIFHWIIGNSLRKLSNHLPSTRPDKIPSHRPSHISLNNNSNDAVKLRSFLINNNKPPNDDLRQLFAKEKDDCGISNIHKFSLDGDRSTEVFLSPTDEDSHNPFMNSIKTPIKILHLKTADKVRSPVVNNVLAEPMSLNLKAEFQKKLKEKQGLMKLSPKPNIVVSNETTWLAQSNKADVIHMPLTPKKSQKPSNVVLRNGSFQNLSKSQLNQIQIHLSLRRYKIENDKKNITEQSEKSFENSKQRAFFQAIDKEKKIIRRRSLEMSKETSNNDRSEADKRLSMYIKRTSESVVVSPIRRLGSKEMLQSFIDAQSKGVTDGTDNNSIMTQPCDYSNVINENNSMEPPQSLRASEIALPSVHICLDRIIDQNNGMMDVPSVLSNDETNDILTNEPFENISRKNSSPSISSLSSFSNPTSDKNLITKEDYKRSFEILTTSVTSLQEEIRILKQQQLSWNKQISQPPNNAENTGKSENDSVIETPTNNGISLTEITDLPKHVTEIDFDPVNNDPEQQSGFVNKIADFISIKTEDSAMENCGLTKPDSRLEPVHSVSSNSETSSSRNVNEGDGATDFYRDISIEKSESNGCGSENNVILTASFTGYVTEDDVTYSSESIKVANSQPVSFVIAEDQSHADLIGQNADLAAKREEMRFLKIEQFKQKRDHDRENRYHATNGDLSERESKAILKQETNDSVLNRNEEESESHPPVDLKLVSAVKSAKKSQPPRSNIRNVKQESVENLSLASPRKNNWFPTIRQSQRTTSYSTSKLNTNVSGILGVATPSQEYIGPKLFAKTKIKTNRSVIANAISYCCLAGSVNTVVKDVVLKDLAESDGTHFIILFRDSRCQYKSLYLFDLITEELVFLTGNGPKKITHEMVEKFFKYNSGTKQFNPISSTKHLSTAVDAICIQSSHWNTRPTGQIITNALSTNSISQIKTKRLL